MDQQKIGKFIAECRKEKGLTQQELADRLGLTFKAVSKWECGKGLPDVSIFERLCAELGITLNELFAGERITDAQIADRAEDNLESILKDYYKIKKRNKTIRTVICTLAIITAVIFLVRSILAVGLVLGADLLWSEEEQFTEIGEYDKNAFLEAYRGELGTEFLIFPDEITDDMDVAEFQAYFNVRMFGTDGYMVLEYRTDEESFRREVERLAGLEVRIESHEGEIYTNKVLYAEGIYDYPAYITLDGKSGKYEYALIDEAGKRIICVYISYLAPDGFPYPEYMKLDQKAYKKQDTWNSYSIYCHSFDGGKTYIGN